MKKPHTLSYLAALSIGVLLFAAYWKTLFGSASGPVFIAGVAGVALAVSFSLILNYRKNENDKSK
jgi:hypothetical protein